MNIFNAFDNIFGGHDYNIDGQNFHTEDNIFGGENIYENGMLVAETHENFLGGYDIFESGVRVARTESNVFGGENVYSEYNHFEGIIQETVTGFSFLGEDGSYSYSVNEFGNASTILSYQDPLSHIESYILPTMLL